MLAEKLKELREQAALTQRELAQAVGVTSGFIAQIELGDRMPSLEVLLRVAAALHLKRSEQEALMQSYEQTQQQKLEQTMQTRQAAVRGVLRARGGLGRGGGTPTRAGTSATAEEVERELTDDPHLREAYQLLKKALGDPALRDNVLGALRAFAQVAKKDK